MALSNKAIQEFKEIYKKEFKDQISKRKAEEVGKRLLNLLRVIYCLIP